MRSSRRSARSWRRKRRRSMNSFLDGWIARLIAVSAVSLVGAKLSGDVAANVIKGREGAFEITAGGALAGFLIVFLLASRYVSSMQGAMWSDFAIEFGGKPPLPVSQLTCLYQLRDGKDLTRE